MSVRHAAWVLLVLAPVANAADKPAELKTLSDEVISGDLIKVTDKEIIIKSEGKEVATPIAEVLSLKIGDQENLGNQKYTLVELTDASLFHCKSFAIKGKQLTMTLLQGQDVTVPLSVVAYVLTEAHEESYRGDLKEKVLKRKDSYDRLIVKTKTETGHVVNAIAGTFAESADKDGKSIEFTTR